MFISETINMSRSNTSFLNTSANFKQASSTDHQTDFMSNNNREFIGSGFYTNSQNQPLARYKSAPSSFLAALLDSNNNNNNNTDNSSSGDDEYAFFSSLINVPSSNHKSCSESGYHMKQEVIGPVEPEHRPGVNGSGSGQTGYDGGVSGGGGCVVGSYSVGMDMRMNNNNNNNGSSLVRQSSSPAGFFNGFGVMGEIGNYRVHNHAKANSQVNGMSNHMNFSSAPSSTTTRFMPTIPENVNQNIGTYNPENGQLRNANSSANGRQFEPVFPRESWNDSPFSSLKRNRDGEMKMFSNFSILDNQNGETRKSSSGLVHHLSLPKTSAEMGEVEKFLQFQPETTTPCQVRAKRGCATHPRSIAERMRRTRISEKMKKLQDLFPNMDKQTSTADMLDLAVEYIKDLQKQVETLTDTKAKCICPSKPQQT